MDSLTDLLPEEIAQHLGVAPFQGRQIFRWLHKKRRLDWQDMTDLSKALRADLEQRGRPGQLELTQMQNSERTGTKKALFRLGDGESVESVLIRARDRVTLCLSCQVGCALKCSFCATGIAGFARNLAPGEIVEQALWMLRDESIEERTPNIVFMGMGEPMHNYDSVVKSIRLLMHQEGLGIGARKITLSTVGDAKQIARFAEEDWQVRLSVSLHAANDELRDKLVPLNRRHNLERLHQALEDYVARTGRQFTVGWTLLDGVNDRAQDADELTAYMGGLKASVNLIPWNPVADLPYRPSPPPRRQEFVRALAERGIKATLRQEKGQDIDAACGQLRRTHGT